jgi:rhamnosyl/mannosyltransferase
VLPSTERSESFGIVQLEAMACGKPVINTQIDSAVPHVSLDRVTGLTVPPGDSVALAAAITALFADPARRAEMGAAARRRVLESFSADAMARLTLDVYTAALSGSPR